MSIYLLVNAYQNYYNDDSATIYFIAKNIETQKKIKFEVRDFKHRFFVRSQDLEYETKNEDQRTLLGEKLTTLYFNSYSELKTAKYNYQSKNIPIYQQINHVMQFMAIKNIKRFFRLNNGSSVVRSDEIEGILDKDIPFVDDKFFKAGWLDVEQWIEGKFHQRDIDDGIHKVISVAIADDFNECKIYHCLDSRVNPQKHKLYNTQLTPIGYDTEYNMMLDLINTLGSYDIIYIYYQKYDIPAIKNRARKLNIPYNVIDKLNWFQQIDVMEAFDKNDRVKLKDTFKYIHWFKPKAVPLLPEELQKYPNESFGTKYINMRSTQSGGQVTSMSPNELIFYNASDVLDMMALEKPVSVNIFKDIWMFNGLLQIFDAYNHMSKLDPIAIHFLNLNNVRVPMPERNTKRDKEGAYSHPPTKGLHRNVVKIDFSRFYSGVIRGENLSSEIFIDEEFEPFMTIKPDGNVSDKPFMFLTEMAGFLAENRNVSEANAEKAETKDEKMFWKSKAKVEKTMNSGLWGYISNENCRFYRFEIKSKILDRSRHFIKGFIDFYESIGYDVLNGFTDSVDVQLKEGDDVYELAERGNQWLIEECKRLGYVIPITAKPETIADPALFLEKQNYALNVVWTEGMANDERLENSFMQVKGLATIRSDVPIAIRDLQRELMETIFNNENFLEMGKKYYKDKINEIKTHIETIENNLLSREMVARPIKFKEDVEHYIQDKPDVNGRPRANPKKYQAVAAKTWNESFPNNPIEAGDKPFGFKIVNKYWMNGVPTTRWLIYNDDTKINWKEVTIDTKEILKDARAKAHMIFSALGVNIDEMILWEAMEGMTMESFY